MPLNEVGRAAATLFRERLEQALGDRLLELRVFGSRARGDAHFESDLDVLVLVEGEESALLKPVVATACQVASELDLPFCISPLVMGRAQFEALQQREVRLARDLAAEGISI